MFQQQQMSSTLLENLRVFAINDKLGTLLTAPPLSPPANAVLTYREPDTHPSKLFESNPDHCDFFCYRSSFPCPLLPNNASKGTFVVAALRGNARCWTNAFFKISFHWNFNFSMFSKWISVCFDHQEEAAKYLLSMTQGKMVADHSISMTVETEWVELVLRGGNSIAAN